MKKKLLLFAFLFCSCNAFAYVDPGSGFILWQGLIALLGFIIIFFRNPIKVIKALISRLFKK